MKAFVLVTVTRLAISSSADEGRVAQQMKVEAPILTEEDQHREVMPYQYRCDSCKAVVFHLNQALKKRKIKSRRMHEWEYNELFEETCDGAFEGYGIKLINGKNTLSGPGLKHQDNIPAGGAFIQMSSKGWSNRLSAICRSTVYEKIGEDDLYEKFYTNGKIPESMCYDELAQCDADLKSKKSKAGNKKANSKAASGKNLGRSEAVPLNSEEHFDYVHKIVGLTLEEKVFSETMDAVLLVTSSDSQCSLCKAVEKHVELLGAKVRAEGLNDVTIIGRLDAARNDSPVKEIKWKTVPTLFHIKAGSREVEEYNEGFEAKKIWKWVKGRHSKSLSIKDRIAENKKTRKAGGSAGAAPAKSKDLPKVEVKSDGSTIQANKGNKTGPGGVEAIDAYGFLQSMAHEDGLDFDAYSSVRSREDWEKLIVSMAGKIYSRQV